MSPKSEIPSTTHLMLRPRTCNAKRDEQVVICCSRETASLTAASPHCTCVLNTACHRSDTLVCRIVDVMSDRTKLNPDRKCPQLSPSSPLQASATRLSPKISNAVQTCHSQRIDRVQSAATHNFPAREVARHHTHTLTIFVPEPRCTCAERPSIRACHSVKQWVTLRSARRGARHS